MPEPVFAISDKDHQIAELTRINEELHAEVRTLKFKVQTLTNDLDNAIRANYDPITSISGNPITGEVYGRTTLKTFANQALTPTIDTEDGA